MSLNITLKKIKRLFKDDSKPKSTIHEYWSQPKDGTNKPEEYLVGVEKSEYLYSKISDLPKDTKILEVGCNVGRNLGYLLDQGFTNLTGIELSSNAVETMKSHNSKVFENCTIHNITAEEFFEANTDEFDLIYTVAVLEHVHTDSNWILEKMASSAKNIVTIEDEKSISWKHFPRNYQKVFEGHGMKQVATEDAQHVPHLHKGFFFRRFTK